jgi:C4-dicarboxylate transporter, DctQ subunit
MKFLNKLLSRIEEVIVAISLVIATGLAFTEVILRYFFSLSLGFTHEAVVFLLIITGLIGASIGVREKVHIGVDLLVKQFPVKFHKPISVTTYVLSTLFCLFITILGIQHIQILFEFGQVTPEMEMPLYIPKSVVPISFGLMTIRFIQETFKEMKKPAEDIYKEEEGVL